MWILSDSFEESVKTGNIRNMLYFCVAQVLLYFGETLGARFIHLGVPGSVSKGDSVWLECGYDLEGDELYSVKWYKDNVEFYRYLPGDTPSAQMYSLKGVFLDLHQSNETHAYLCTSDFDTEGDYRCEVSTEVPSFNTIKANKELRIYVTPETGPRINSLVKNYRVGDVVNMSCLYGPSKPKAEITWIINEEEAPIGYVHSNQVFSEIKDLEISESRLLFSLEPQRLWQGSLTVQCIALISHVLATSSLELIVGEGTTGAEFQRILHVPPGQEPPVITGAMPKYFVGDIVDLNCSSARSNEIPELKWYINDNEARPEFLITHAKTQYPDGLSSVKNGIKFTVMEEHLKTDEMKIKCTAIFSRTIKKSSEAIVILGDNHRSSSFHISDRSGTVNMVLSCSLQWILFLVCISRSVGS